MPVVSLEQLRPGLVLAADMKTVHGRLLAGSGSKVTAELLKIARIWGITEAEVEESISDKSLSDPLADLSQKQLKLLNALIAWRFALSRESSPWLKHLKKISRNRAAQEMLTQDP
ncbi:MAG: HDOD domain-containing protein, partial [Desulfonatronovibrionaceae bacterium]